LYPEMKTEIFVYRAPPGKKNQNPNPNYQQITRKPTNKFFGQTVESKNINMVKCHHEDKLNRVSMTAMVTMAKKWQWA